MLRRSYAAAVTVGPARWRSTTFRRGELAPVVRAVEWVFAFAGLLTFAGATTALLGAAGLVGGGFANTVRQLLLPPIFFGAAIVLVVHPGGAIEALRRNAPAAILGFLTLLSLAWSSAPDLTLKRSLMLAGLTAFALFLLIRFDERAILVLVAGALGLISLVSAVVALAVPAHGIASGTHAGAWIGIYGDKNGFGRITATAVMAFVALAHGAGPRGRRYWAAAAACALLVLLSRSATALLAMTCAFAAFPLRSVLRQRGVTMLLMATLALMVVTIGPLLLLPSLERLAVMLGKDPTLSGRVPVWMALIDRFWEQPWLGYGYAAFWTSRWGAPAPLQLEATGEWNIWHAHNGFLELALGLGLLGTLMFMAACLVALARAAAALRAPVASSIWPLAYLIFFLVANLGESMVLGHTSLWWMLFLVTVFGLRRSPSAATVALPGTVRSLSPSIRRARMRLLVRER